MKHYGTMHVPTASSISYAIEALAECVPMGTEKIELVLNLEAKTLHVIGRDPEELWVEREMQQAVTAPLTPTKRGQAWRDAFHREEVNRFGDQSRISLRRADAEAMELNREIVRRTLDENTDSDTPPLTTAQLIEIRDQFYVSMWREIHRQRESAAAHPPATAAPAPPPSREVLEDNRTTPVRGITRRVLAKLGIPM